MLVPVFQKYKKFLDGYIAGKEIGKGTNGVPEGTPHIQGYIEFKDKTRPFTVFGEGLPKAIHWEPKYPRAKAIHNIAYCSKDGDFIYWGNCKPKISMEIEATDILPYEDMFDWGRALEDMVKDRLPAVTERTIYWIWSREGCMKKTETARRLVYYHDAIVVQGGRKHILATAYKNPAPIYILLIPRTDEGYVSYASIELLKDSLFMSGFGTEATGMVNRKKPWVIVMCNFEPDMTTLSLDRYNIQNVDIHP